MPPSERIRNTEGTQELAVSNVSRVKLEAVVGNRLRRHHRLKKKDDVLQETLISFRTIS